MLLMQEPELLLVDEPVAGMTPQETERTAELLLSLAGKHSVVVVEHDMEFVRSIASRVTVLHEGRVLAEGDMDDVQNDPRVIEVYLGRMSLLAVSRRSTSRTAAATRCGTSISAVAAGLAHLPHGPQRHGQDDAAQVHHGPAAGHVRRDRRSTGTDLRHAAGRGARAARHRLRAAGPRDLSAAHRRGEPARRPRRAARAARRRFPPQIFELFPGAEADAAAGAAATSPAVSSSSSRSGARSCSSRSCSSSTSRPKAFSRTSCTRSATSSCGSIARRASRCCWSSRSCRSRAASPASSAILEKGRCVAGGAIDELTDDVVREHLSV